MDDGWQWFWLAAAVFLVIGEVTTPGMFFALSFAIGAVISCALAFAGVEPAIQWLAFVVVSLVSLAILVPLGRRLSGGDQAAAVGATRFSGRRAVVLQEIPAGPHATGLVRMEREEWRAESIDGSAVAAGETVAVVRVDGTRLIVGPVEEAS